MRVDQVAVVHDDLALADHQVDPVTEVVLDVRHDGLSGAVAVAVAVDAALVAADADVAVKPTVPAAPIPAAARNFLLLVSLIWSSTSERVTRQWATPQGVRHRQVAGLVAGA